MSEQTKSRFAIDLDDLEKQLRSTASAQPKAVSSDPLADLARIVGQDDPFKSLFADKRAGAVPPPPVQVAPPVPRRIEPHLATVLHSERPMAAARNDEPAAGNAADALQQQDMRDAFERLLQGELRGTTAPVEAAKAQPQVLAPAGGDVADGFGRERSHAGLGAHELKTDDLDELSSRIRADETLPEDLGQPLPPADYPEPPEAQPDDLRSLEPQQPRKGLVIAGILLGVAALGVGAVVGLRGLSGPVRTSGEAPVIRAEAGPAKVAPQNPGGVEIPNQNKQIYERTPEPKPGEARVVTREEQPMDVQATARAAARVILPGPGSAPANGTPANPAVAQPSSAGTEAMPAPVVAAVPPVAAPAPQPAASAQPPASALGEPRRVRTIAVRPDGTIAPGNGSATGSTPAATPQAAPVAPRPAAPSVTASTPPARSVAPRPPADETPAARPAPPRAQVAAAPATATVAQPAPRTAEPAGGGFMVQLGAPGSEAEARSTFSSLQRRFSDQLADASPVIRRADVGNGRTVYRLRVGPFSREEAAEKCQALQAAGGQCFIARN